jgi:hypothetical protein
LVEVLAAFVESCVVGVLGVVDLPEAFSRSTVFSDANTASLETFPADGLAGVALVVATVPAALVVGGTGMERTGATAMRAMMVFLTSMIMDYEWALEKGES